MKTKVIRLSLWKWDGVLVAGGTAEDFAAFAKRDIKAVVDVGTHSAGHAYVEYGRPFALWVESLDNVPALAHEALHITSGVLEARGLKHTPESEEAYTYTMEAIIREALRRQGWRRVSSR